MKLFKKGNGELFCSTCTFSLVIGAILGCFTGCIIMGQQRDEIVETIRDSGYEIISEDIYGKPTKYKIIIKK